MWQTIPFSGSANNVRNATMYTIKKQPNQDIQLKTVFYFHKDMGLDEIASAGIQTIGTLAATGMVVNTVTKVVPGMTKHKSYKKQTRVPKIARLNTQHTKYVRPARKVRGYGKLF